MRFAFVRQSAVLWMVTGLMVCLVNAAYPQSHDLKLEAQLIWATNDSASPDPHHKRAEEAVYKKLQASPFRWTNYFEINRKQFTLPSTGEHREQMSRECEIKVRNTGDSHIEVQLFGKGKLVGRIKQSLPKDKFLVTGGNAENATAWFVVLRQVE